MQLKLGQPTIFFTISPDSTSTFRIANLAGFIPDDVLEEMETGVRECLGYTKAKLGQIATSNPYLCARYFERLMEMFIDVVLNWDTEGGCSRNEPGLFGHTQAFYAATESQNSTGSLHSHMLIWIQNMPSTVEEYYAMCSSKRFQTAMVRYVEAISTSNVPLDMSLCPMCGVGEIKALELQRQAFKKPRPGAKRPATCFCESCGQNFGADELILRSCNLVPNASEIECSDESTFNTIANTRPLPRVVDTKSQEAVTVSRALASYQNHYWFHTKSCFKITKRTPHGDICRMFMPKETCEETKWTPDQRIEMKRSPGNEYVNSYVPTVNALFKCNHDIKFLGAGEGPEKAFYIIKYATKHQQDLENPWALHMHAFDKANKPAVCTEDNQAAAGRRRIQSMCCTLTNPHEVSAPMACLYVSRGSAMYSSHQFVRLHIQTILRSLFCRQEQLDVVLESDNSKHVYKPSSIWMDYVYRPAVLDSVDLMTFVEKWSRRKSNKGMQFLRGHPQHGTHRLFGFQAKRIVTITHKRLPDTRRTDLPDDELLRFQQTVLALFRPFRSEADFETNDDDFGEKFERWLAKDAPSYARTFVKNNADYYASRELLKSQNDPEVDRYRGYAASFDEHDDLNTSDAWVHCDDEGDDCDPNLDDDEQEIVWAPAQVAKHIKDLAHSTNSVDLAASSTLAPVSTVDIAMGIEDVERTLSSLSTTVLHSGATSTNSTLLTEYPDLPTRVTLFQNSIGTGEIVAPGDQINAPVEDCVDTTPDLPSLRLVSTALQLNEKQTKMFVNVGKKLLSSLLLGNDSTEPIVAFLGGKPGAGKSRVIRALQVLAQKWKSDDSVATCAYQGVAAQSVNGQTIHKLFGWYVKRKNRWTPTQQQKERFAKLKLLIVDEVSTCDVSILGKIDASLREILDNPSKLFGGIHMLLVGDWLQQLPVAGQPAFVSAEQVMNLRHKDPPDYLDRVRGIKAYRSINSVVILTNNMRHRGDPVWKVILDKWRVGKFEEADIEHVNKIAHDENWTALDADMKGYCPIIVTSNALRVEFNTFALRSFCKQSKVILHQFPATVERPRYRLTSPQRKSLERIRDDKSGGMPIVLEIAIGSTVQCTKNVSAHLKLANGSIGTVVAFTPAKNDAVQVHVVDGIEEHHHSLVPDIVFVKLKDYSSQSFLPGLPPGVVPVCKRRESGVKIKLPDREFSVSITQVPLVAAYSLTTEKCQGLTVDKMVLAPLRHPTRRSPQRSSFYVAVTRVKSLSQLYLMSPLTKTFLEYFKPPKDVWQECLRVEGMES